MRYYLYNIDAIYICRLVFVINASSLMREQAPYEYIKDNLEE